MLDFIIALIFLFSLIYGIYSGNISDLSVSAVNGGVKAIKLVLILAGSMALWCGILNIADKAGIINKLCKIISPVTNKILKNLNENPKARKAVNMNIVANLLGLGNAATPMGIEAVKEMNKEISHNSRRNTAVFTVLNCTSIQLIPTTVSAVRASHGSVSPFVIIPPVIITSLISAAVGCLTAYLLYKPKGKNNEIC